MASATLTIRVDGGALMADLELLEDAASRSGEVRKRLVDLLQQSPNLARVDVNHNLALGAGEVGIRFQLAQPFAELVSALRAGQVDGFVVQD